MRLKSQRKASILFFTVLGICLVALAVALNVGWIILNLREVVLLVLGVIFFLVIIAGLVLNTIFLIREIRLNEQHDSFINAVTHELKTPIASMRLYLETLQTREVDEAKRQEFYRIMLADNDRLLHTVEQVLRASRTQHSQRTVERVALDLGVLARDCVELARTRTHLNVGELRFVNQLTNGEQVWVKGDPDELRAVLSNLIDNAIKYSGKRVDVAVTLAAPSAKQAVLYVSDQGIGLAPNQLKRIFKRFYRVPARVALRVKGTGLGLFIVRSVIEKHDGKVFAESAGEGLGSTFTIQLPRLVMAAENEFNEVKEALG
ncbi:MAG: HAMP domain-containing histidine kinase [Acidobacteria bacterium]|nr:HAMP domain-containing histidine kinase [Acidobacteriota bacterium]